MRAALSRLLSREQMASSRERLAELRRRIKEFETVSASFQSMNGNLRMRCVDASEEIKAFCARHIEQNDRSISAMQKSLEHMKVQLTDETH